MSVGNGGGGEDVKAVEPDMALASERVWPVSAPPSAPGSPKSKVKFLCSHGGKILPRPSDGQLKYVGGETRVLAVPRDIKFSELMKKLTNLFDGDMILKYQLLPEDLDALVSVKNDEDLRHMLEEYDRHESAGTPRLRAFLFSANPTLVDNNLCVMDPHALEQRYIDAINGIFRSSSGTKPSYSMSSAGSSPKSPDSGAVDSLNHDTLSLSGFQSGKAHMHKVQSSPSLCSMNIPSNNSTQHVHHHHHYRQHQHHGLPIRPPPEPHKSSLPDRLASIKSFGRVDNWRHQVAQSPNHYYPPNMHSSGSGCFSKYSYHEEPYGHQQRRYESPGRSPQRRYESPCRSPSLPRSPP